MTWILWAVVGAAVVHVLEEYLWPGGFLATIRTAAPRLGPSSPPAAFVINALLIAGLAACAVIGRSVPFLSLSGASLVFVNGCVHVAASLRVRRYVPGLVSGLMLYLPLSVTAYVTFARAGYLSPATVGASAALGVLYQITPLAYLYLRHMMSRGLSRSRQ